jgi:hypothetical protein
MGDRQSGTFPSYINGAAVGANTGVLVLGQRDASVPLAIQANSATQSANLTEWRNASGTALDVIDETGSLGVGTSAFDGTNPEKLLVDAGNTSSYNVISGKGTINNYLQLNIQNRSSGTSASSDVVATADNGNETANFIDMGINSSTYSSAGILGGANNAYLYSTGNDFVIGNSSSGKNIRLFTGGSGTANERVRIDGSGNVGVGTTTPAATMDVNGTFKLGASGTALSNMIKSNFTLNDATTFNNTSTRTLTATVTGAAVNGTVIVSPRSALPAGIGIAWARVSGANTITIAFTNTDTSSKSLGTVTFDVTVIQ